MKIINKTMDLKDLENEDAKKLIKELEELDKKFEEKGCHISSWIGKLDYDPFLSKINMYNRGYDYKPIFKDEKLDWKYPNFLLWETYWVYSNLDIKKGDKVLDIGGACSLFSFYLASKGAKVVAIDLNQELADNANKIAKTMGLDYTAICADGEEFLSTTEEKFDYITSICVVEHIEINKRRRLMQNLDRCLKEGGTIAFTFDYKNPSKFVMINNEKDIKDLFLCSGKLRLVENQEFYDNNVNYLVEPFYRKEFFWKYKLYHIKHKNFPITEIFKTKDYNDYTFGAVFLKVK